MIFLSSAYGVSPGPTSRNSFFHSFIRSFRIQFRKSVTSPCPRTFKNILEQQLPVGWWRHQASHNIAGLYSWTSQCAVHVYTCTLYTLTTQTVPTTHSEIKSAWVWTLQLLAYNNQGKYRIIGTSIDFVNLRLIMNRVGILARATTSNEIYETKILAVVSTLQSSTRHKNKLK